MQIIPSNPKFSLGFLLGASQPKSQPAANAKLWLLVPVLLVAFTSNAWAQQEHKLSGKWAISYPDFDWSAEYEFRTEGSSVVGYCVTLIDQDGTRHADNSKLLTELHYDGTRGTAQYKLEYEEGESITLPCTIASKGSGTLQVSYSYEGYSSTETWRKL